MSLFLITTLNGLAFSSLLFLVSIGFTLIFGLMRIVNLTHGSFFLLGGYVGVSTLAFTGNFFLALLAAGLCVALLGIVLETALLRRFHGKHLDQILLTLALWFALDDAMLVAWGGYPYRIPAPEFLVGPVAFFGMSFPKYRVALVAVGIVVALGMWMLIEKTRMGALIRAGADNEEIARAMGINVDRVFVLAFALGAFLAGIGGVLGAPMLGVANTLSGLVLTMAIVVVVVGGLGSLKGAVAGSLFVGLVNNFGQAYFPAFAYFSVFLPMALVLAFRPRGLFGRA